MNDSPLSRVLDAIHRVTGSEAKRNGKGWTACCPAHDDRNPSVSIAEREDGGVLLHCHAGCTPEAIVSACGLTMRDLMPEDTARSTPRKASARTAPKKPAPKCKTFPTANDAIASLERKLGKRSAAWTYHDRHSKPAGVVVRWDTPEGKTIRPVARYGTTWRIGAMPEPRPLYHLTELANATRVYIYEGEKAADAVRALGLTATTSPHGSKSASKADWSPLAGKEVVILPDADEPGERYAEDVVDLLGKLHPAPTVKIVTLPDLPDRGDAVEFVAARRAAGLDDEAIRAELEGMADAAEPVEPVPDRLITMPVLVRLADVQPEPVRWLWPGRFALGKLALIAGDPGLGKSFISLDMAARVSRGTAWPDERGTPNPVGGVVLLSAEDDLADTIRPRLDAAGADVDRIIAVQAVRRFDPEDDAPPDVPFCLKTDLPALENAIRQVTNCRLVVIDPISAYLGGVDDHKNAGLRAVLAPLAQLAASHRVTVVAVTHLRKSEGPAMYRAMGSLAYTAAARAVWAVTKDKDDQRRRLMLPVKNNLAADVQGLAYSIESDGPNGGPVVAWEPEPVSISADDALTTDRPDQDDQDETVNFLREMLAGGEQPAADVFKQSRENGFSDKATRKAFKALGGKRSRVGFGKGGTWYWSLTGGAESPVDPIGGIDAPSETPGNNGNNGNNDGWGEL